MLKWKKHLFSKSSMNTVPVCELHRWALSPISVMSDIGLSLNRTVRYRTERLKICRIFRYRTKVFCDIRYPTSKFFKSPVALLRFFKRGDSRCKIGSADLHGLAARGVVLFPSRNTASNVHNDLF
jgi:hypothetical protein